MFHYNQKTEKGQGALEYLLLISGALIIAVIVTVLLISISASSKVATENKVISATNMTSNVAIPAALNSVICTDVTCTVFFMEFGGTHQLVIDDANSADIINNVATYSSPITAGTHSAHLLTTSGTSVNISNTIYFDVGSSGGTPIETVATPTANPSSQGFETSVSVSLSCTTASANIYYTTDGSAPTNGSNPYSGSILISSTTTLKAIAYLGSTASSIMSETYTQNSGPEIIDLSFKPPSGTPVHLEDSIKIITSPETSKIFYTLDGSNPNQGSAHYEDNIKITDNFTLIKAIAYLDEKDSGVQSANYTVEGYVAMPVAEPGPGMVAPNTMVTLSTTTPGAKIFYVINEGDPAAGESYIDPIEISEPLIIFAIAELDGVFSEVLKANYDIGEEVFTPFADPGSGTYNEPILVQLKTDTAEARIFYTLDGSTPSSLSTRYENDIKITENTTLKAIAVLGETSSGVMTETYIFE